MQGWRRLGLTAKERRREGADANFTKVFGTGIGLQNVQNSVSDLFSVVRVFSGQISLLPQGNRGNEELCLALPALKERALRLLRYLLLVFYTTKISFLHPAPSV